MTMSILLCSISNIDYISSSLAISRSRGIQTFIEPLSPLHHEKQGTKAICDFCQYSLEDFPSRNQQLWPSKCFWSQDSRDNYKWLV